MYKVLITSRSFGQIDDESECLLKEAGFDIIRLKNDFDRQEFAQMVQNCDALVIGGHRFEPEDMQKAKKLKIICKHGAGLDNIPLKEAARLGIAVTNVPGANSGAVADLTMGLMLCLARKVIASANYVQAGVWKPCMGEDVFGKTLGLLGFGAIARNVAQRAGGFSMNVLTYDPYVTQVTEDLPHVKLASMKDVLVQSDFISLHLPLNESTYGLIGRDEMQIMKKGVYIINTSRGGIIDESALRNEVLAGRVAGAALDVLEREDDMKNQPLLGLENVIITSHIGMYSKEAINKVSIVCAQNVVNFFAGKPLQHKVSD